MRYPSLQLLSTEPKDTAWLMYGRNKHLSGFRGVLTPEDGLIIKVSEYAVTVMRPPRYEYWYSWKPTLKIAPLYGVFLTQYQGPATNYVRTYYATVMYNGVEVLTYHLEWTAAQAASVANPTGFTYETGVGNSQTGRVLAGFNGPVVWDGPGIIAALNAPIIAANDASRNEVANWGAKTPSSEDVYTTNKYVNSFDNTVGYQAEQPHAGDVFTIFYIHNFYIVNKATFSFINGALVQESQKPFTPVPFDTHLASSGTAAVVRVRSATVNDPDNKIHYLDQMKSMKTNPQASVFYPLLKL